MYKFFFHCFHFWICVAHFLSKFQTFRTEVKLEQTKYGSTWGKVLKFILCRKKKELGEQIMKSKVFPPNKDNISRRCLNSCWAWIQGIFHQQKNGGQFLNWHLGVNWSDFAPKWISTSLSKAPRKRSLNTWPGMNLRSFHKESKDLPKVPRERNLWIHTRYCPLKWEENNVIDFFVKFS